MKRATVMLGHVPDKSPAAVDPRTAILPNPKLFLAEPTFDTSLRLFVFMRHPLHGAVDPNKDILINPALLVLSFHI